MTAGAGRAGGGNARIRVAGFTLVELLVSIAVFALLAAAGVTIIAHVLDQRSAINVHAARVADLQRAHSLMKADLGQAAVRRTRGFDGQPARAAFGAAGPGDRVAPMLAFVRRGWSNHDDVPRASLQHVEYRIEDGRLLRRTRPHLDGARPGEAQVLLEGIRSATASFYSHAQWSDGWSGGIGELPEAVALELELESFGRIRQVFLLPADGA